MSHLLCVANSIFVVKLGIDARVNGEKEIDAGEIIPFRKKESVVRNFTDDKMFGQHAVLLLYLGLQIEKVKHGHDNHKK